MRTIRDIPPQDLPGTIWTFRLGRELHTVQIERILGDDGKFDTLIEATHLTQSPHKIRFWLSEAGL